MSLQDEARKAMDMVFNQFKRSDLVTFYKTSSEEVVAHDPNWNSDFGNPYTQNIVKTEQKMDFECRIWWPKDPRIIKSLDGEANMSLKMLYPYGEVRIQVKQDGFEWLKDAKTFWIKGERFTRSSDWMGIGMLGDIDRYELVLNKDQ